MVAGDFSGVDHIGATEPTELQLRNLKNKQFLSG